MSSNPDLPRVFARIRIMHTHAQTRLGCEKGVGLQSKRRCGCSHTCVCEQPGESVEARFARKLANNDLRTRSKALRSLKKWMTARSAVEDGGTTCATVYCIHVPACVLCTLDYPLT